MNRVAIPSVADEQRLIVENGTVQKLQHLSLELLDYVYEHCITPHPSMDAVRANAARDAMGFMQTAPDQTALLYMLAKISGARKVLEIGCYLGHGALAMLSAIGKSGHLLALDHNETWAKSACATIEAAGFSSAFELRLGPAEASLLQLRASLPLPQFDLVFIDADKVNAPRYYDLVVDLVRPGGLIVCDNVLWRGHVVDAGDQSARAVALRALNALVASDSRVESLILTVSDGMLVARKKELPDA